MKYIVTAPWWLRRFFPSFITWSVPAGGNEIFLTFDDGPHPEATPFVLDLLKQYNAKATFFCIGKNVKDQPLLYRRIIDEGHKTGNHTYNHLNGKKVSEQAYIDDILLAAQVIDSKLFRPPYGAITGFAARQLHTIFNIVMWNVLSADFDTAITGQKCLDNVVKNTKSGAIIVFHDSAKALPHLQYALPLALKFFTEKGYQMKALHEQSA